MKLEIRIGGRTRQVELARQGQLWVCQVDGRRFEADVAQVSERAYSILLSGRAFEARVLPGPEGLRIHIGNREFAVVVLDPRVWRGRRGGVLEAEGRQQVCAPMPGKVVRLLVRQGDAVEAGQGLLVVEAMKMQNEVRSPKSGTVERLPVSEGQAVNAGDVLAVVA
jgi:biotin carboxyl carrier protein